MTARPLVELDRLPETFYDRCTIEVAQDLIGKAILRRVGEDWLGGWIVETEAYLDRGDPASHSARGPTAGNASMFAGPGTLYVYPIHAKYCMNAVTQGQGIGSAVLIRAIDPVWGIESMRRFRNHVDLNRLTTGPAKLCQAIHIDRRDDGRNLIDDETIGIFKLPNEPKRRVRAGKRIGISKAKQRNLRFVDVDSNYLSRKLPPINRR